MRLAARHQGLAHAPIDDIVRRRASRGPSLQCLPLWMPRVELSARWLRSCRIVAPQNTSAFLPKWEPGRLWPRGGFDGGIPSSWPYAYDRNGAPPNPSGWRQIGASNTGCQAIDDSSISSVDRRLRRWRPCEVHPSYQMRSFEVMLACVSNDQGEHQLFSSVPVEADRSVSSSAPSCATSAQRHNGIDGVERRSRRPTLSG